MRYLKIAICLALILTLLSGCGFIRTDESKVDKSVVARVDGDIISKEQFDKIFGVFKAQIEKKEGPEIWDRLINGEKYIDLAKQNVLEQMIQDKIQLKKAEELGIDAAKEEIDTEIDKWKNLFDSDEKFEEFLDSLNMDNDYFYDSIKKDIILSKLRESLTKNVDVTEEEMIMYYNTHLDLYNRVKASHILLETEEEAREVLERIEAGEDFNGLAKEYSIDPSVKSNNGDLGYFRYGDMVEPFEAAAFSLKVNEISDPVKSEYGYHIIRVEDRKVDRFEDIKDELKEDMIIEKKNMDYTANLEELFEESKIEKFIKNL